MQPFETLLMDEPFSHLDKNNIAKAAQLIGEECKKRNASFVITDLDADENFEYSKILHL
jgi:putative ABC transport system ATP-binding protein